MPRFYVSFRGTRNGEWIHADSMAAAKLIFMERHGGLMAYIRVSRTGPNY